MTSSPSTSFFFFFNDTATTEIYTLSLHDALPISIATVALDLLEVDRFGLDEIDQKIMLTLLEKYSGGPVGVNTIDRKSTRLNSSHQIISYAVFCLKKKKKQTPTMYTTAHTLYHQH